MICYNDKSYCFSPDCQNKCGRMLTNKDRELKNRMRLPISGRYYCGNPDKNKKEETKND